MQKKIFFFLFIFSFFLFDSYKVNASFDKKQVEILVSLYEELLITYSNAPNEDVADSKRMDLYKLFEVPQLEHAFDLFNNEEDDELNAESYLRIIKTVYDNKILIDFTNLHIFSCTGNINGVQFAYATLNKKLEYVGNKNEFINKRKNVKILIGINVSKPDYKINLIVFPEEFKSPNSGCVIDEKQDEQNVLFGENFALAELSLKREDYISAKQFYEKALLYKPLDSKILLQLSKCNSIINYESYQTNAEEYFSEGYFSKAKELFEKIVSQYPDQKENALDKIKTCDDQIRLKNYSEYKKMGDDGFNKHFYGAASENYRTALKYNPNDPYSISMIKKCANADVSRAMNGIKKARELISLQNKKYFPEIIQIYTYFEPSGLLSGQDYYNMAAILDVAYGNVSNTLKYTKVQSYHLAKEYCLKSMAKGYGSADGLWYDRFNQKARKQ